MAITVSVASITVPFATLAQTVANNPAASSSAAQFRSDGIFGCNQTGAAASSVGTISASGTYVPVADAAVILNTGYLVYLACSLRPLVSALSQNATAGLVKKIIVSFNSGNDGGPQFSQNIDNETTDVANKRFVKIIQGGVLNTINPAIKGVVQTAVVRAYSASVQQPNAVLRCPYAGDLQALLKGKVWSKPLPLLPSERVPISIERDGPAPRAGSASETAADAAEAEQSAGA